jgi:hypothetical protein
LTRKYDGFIYKCLLHIFPEYDWKPWRFVNIEDGYWDIENNVHDYLKWITKELSITNIEDWYHISDDYLKEKHGYR